jgi:hypothetical protein
LCLDPEPSGRDLLGRSTLGSRSDLAIGDDLLTQTRVLLDRSLDLYLGGLLGGNRQPFERAFKLLGTDYRLPERAQQGFGISKQLD